MAQDTKYQLAGDIDSENAYERLRVLKWMQSFERTGERFYTTEDTIVVKLQQKVLFDLIEKLLYEVVDSDLEYTVRRVSSRYNAYFFLGKSIPEEEHDTEEFVAQNDVLRLTLAPSDSNYDYELDRTVNTQKVSTKDSRENLVLSTDYRIVGEEELVVQFETRLRERITELQREQKSSLVNWLYSSGHSTARKTFQVNKTWDIHHSYYPWINKPLTEYYKTFLDSDAQILVLWGTPGTGKTSWVRDMICEMNLNAFISYDTKVLTSDSTFVSYLLDPLYNAIIMEDADDFLTADRKDNDKLISKILNISDGLIKLPKKKLIFSTNLPSVAQIDKAIIRPGRCFDVMEFRNLTHKEAKVAADHLGVTIDNTSRHYSLAELFGLKITQQTTDPLLTNHGSRFSQGIGFLQG